MPIEMYFKDGLRFRTKDGNFEGRFGGRLLGHSRTVFDRPDDDTAPTRSVPDTFFVRQARLETEGTFYKEFGYKAQVDFGSGLFNQSTGAGPSSVSGTLRDGFVEWKRWPELQVRLGQFFEPFSQEDMCSTRFIDFVERSPLNRLAPGREIGLQLFGTALESQVAYFLMLSNGGALLNDQGRAVVDRDDEKEVAGLVRWSPFLKSDETFLKGLRLGLAGTIGSADSQAGSGFDLVTTELSVLYLDSTSGLLDGRRWRLDPQLSWAIGPFSLRGEYVWREDELDEAAPESDLESSGWYAAATWLLTGESKKPEDRVVPGGEWGAVEVVLRAAGVDVENAFDAGIASPVGNSEEVTTITGGVNWWVTRNVRLSMNVVHERYDDDLAFDNRTEDSLTGLLFRGQIDF
jgi:phosphate-selective porin OprO/OprP